MIFIIVFLLGMLAMLGLQCAIVKSIQARDRRALISLREDHAAVPAALIARIYAAQRKDK